MFSAYKTIYFIHKTHENSMIFGHFRHFSGFATRQGAESRVLRAHYILENVQNVHIFGQNVHIFYKMCTFS